MLYLDSEGKEFLRWKYDVIHRFVDGYAVVIKDEEIFLINKKWEEFYKNLGSGLLSVGKNFCYYSDHNGNICFLNVITGKTYPETIFNREWATIKSINYSNLAYQIKYYERIKNPMYIDFKSLTSIDTIENIYKKLEKADPAITKEKIKEYVLKGMPTEEMNIKDTIKELKILKLV